MQIFIFCKNINFLKTSEGYNFKAITREEGGGGGADLPSHDPFGLFNPPICKGLIHVSPFQIVLAVTE